MTYSVVLHILLSQLKQGVQNLLMAVVLVSSVTGLVRKGGLNRSVIIRLMRNKSESVHHH